MTAIAGTWTRRGGRIGLVLALHAAVLQVVLNAPTPRRMSAMPPSVDVALIAPPKPPPVVLPPQAPKLAPKVAAPPKRAPLLVAKAAVAAVDDAPMAMPAEPVKTPPPRAAPAQVETPAVRIAARIDASVSCPSPDYPRASKLAGETGTVRLLFLIGTEGQVMESRVEASSGSSRLDEAARQGLSLCHFAPGTVDGRPELSWARLDYVWRLR